MMMQDGAPEEEDYYYWSADSTHQSTSSFESEPETDDCDQLDMWSHLTCGFVISVWQTSTDPGAPTRTSPASASTMMMQDDAPEGTDHCEQHRAVSLKEGCASKVCALATELEYKYDDDDDSGDDTAPFALWKQAPFVLSLSELLYGANAQDLTRTRSEPAVPSAACQGHLTESFEFEPDADDWDQFVDL